MRIFVASAAILAAALAGCGQRAGNGQNVAGQSGLPTPGPRPTGQPDSGSSARSSFEQGFRQSYRTSGIETCVSAARTRAAQAGGPTAGVDFQPYCTCFIDRHMAGQTVDQLASPQQPGPREQAMVEQCARENGLAPRGNGRL